MSRKAINWERPLEHTAFIGAIMVRLRTLDNGTPYCHLVKMDGHIGRPIAVDDFGHTMNRYGKPAKKRLIKNSRGAHG